MSQWFAIDDLIAAGLGSEIAGAILLAEGLGSVNAILGLGTTFIGANPHAVAAAIERRARSR